MNLVKWQLLLHETFLRRLSIKTRTQVSEQGDPKTFIAIITYQNVTCVNLLASKVVMEEGMGKCE